MLNSPDLQGLPEWSWGEFHTFLWSLWSWACTQFPPYHQCLQTAVWSLSFYWCRACPRLSFSSCITWEESMFKLFNKSLFWLILQAGDSLCPPFLLHLRFCSLASVSHLCPLQFANQRQDLSGGFISAGTVDQRSVRLQHQVRVLQSHEKINQQMNHLTALHIAHTYSFFEEICCFQFFPFLKTFTTIKYK